MDRIAGRGKRKNKKLLGDAKAMKRQGLRNYVSASANPKKEREIKGSVFTYLEIKKRKGRDPGNREEGVRGRGVCRDPAENVAGVCGFYVHVGRIWQSDMKRMGHIKSSFFFFIIHVFTAACGNSNPSRAVNMEPRRFS